MILYLAAKYRYRGAVSHIALKLQASGHTVVSRWLTGLHDNLTCGKQSLWAQEDVSDIDSADSIVIFQFPCNADNPEPSTGRHIEFGYALGRKKQVILVGCQTSVFHYLPEVIHFESIDKFLSWMDIQP